MKSKADYLGRIVNYRTNRQTDNEKRKSRFFTQHSQPQTQSFSLNISDSRMGELQKKKRIRTRESEMKRFTTRYKNLINNSFDISGKKPEKSILQVYEEMKKNQTPLSRKVNKNI